MCEQRSTTIVPSAESSGASNNPKMRAPSNSKQPSIDRQDLDTKRSFADAVIRLYEAHYGPSPIVANPVFRQKLEARLRELFSPTRKPGRHQSEVVTLATRLRQEGTPWSSVLLKVIPNYAELHPAERTLERIKLQHAVHARLQRKK